MIYSNFNDTEIRNKYIFAKITRVKALTRFPEPMRVDDVIFGYMTFLPKIGNIITLAQEEKNGHRSIDIFTSTVVKDIIQTDNIMTVSTENSEYSIKILEN